MSVSGQLTPVSSPVLADAPSGLSRPPLFTPDELDRFKARMAPLIDLDLDAYKPRQIERRIAALLCRAGAPNLVEFERMLCRDPQKLKNFVDGLTINVSEFFRNPERFDELKATVLPELLGRFETLKIWSAGCSMGAELYSVGILLEELGALERCELIGTDLDREILKQAESGLYGAHEIGGVSPERFARYFEAEGQSQARFRGEAIRARSRFGFQNLLADAPLSGCHLIMCRNVVIYFTQESKNSLYQRFAEALKPGGMLFVGGTERIFSHRELGFTPWSPFLYQKPVGS